MKKFALWIMSAASAAALITSYNVGSQHLITEAAVTSPAAAVASNQQTSATDSTATSTSTAAQSYTGSSVQTPYGPVQVAVTVQNGQVTAAEAVDYPNSDGHSQRINSSAIPQLNSAASATGTVDTISGATYTSSAYKKSLQSALDQAGL